MVLREKQGCVLGNLEFHQIGRLVFFFGRPKMREIKPEAAKGVSEWQGGQRLDETQLI